MTLRPRGVRSSKPICIRYGSMKSSMVVRSSAVSAVLYFFAKYSGTEFKHEDDELLILRESDILAIVENGK